jgi:hypothetical protein
MFLRIRKRRCSLVETYRDETGKVRQHHLFSPMHTDRSRDSFTVDLLYARKRYRMSDDQWRRIVKTAEPYLSDKEHLRRGRPVPRGLRSPRGGVCPGGSVITTPWPSTSIESILCRGISLSRFVSSER